MFQTTNEFQFGISWNRGSTKTFIYSIHLHMTIWTMTIYIYYYFIYYTCYHYLYMGVSTVMGGYPNSWMESFENPIGWQLEVSLVGILNSWMVYFMAKPPQKNGWYLGVALWLRKPPYIPYILSYNAIMAAVCYASLMAVRDVRPQ